MFCGINFYTATHYIAGKIVLANQLNSVMHLFCSAAFRFVTLYWFLLRIATGPKKSVMRYITGFLLRNELRSVTHYISGLLVLRVEFAIIYGPMDT